MPRAAKNQIKSCVRCNARKAKCDGYPCSTCAHAKIKCVSRLDKRSTRPTNSAWNSLNTKITTLESQLDQVSNQNNFLLQVMKSNKLDVQLPDILPPLNPNAKPINMGNPQYPKPGEFDKIDLEQTTIWSAYGPTSIFNGNEDSDDKDPLSSIATSISGDSVTALTNTSTLGLLNKNPQIIKHIKLFFQWMYPNIHMFVPRETFLIDFYHPKPSNHPTYCTKELVYAICAIGSLLDPTFSESISYYSIAKTRLFLNINVSTMTSLQSFILLGLYDIYRCENDSGWLLTGMGFRIGFNLGFHLSPPENAQVSELTIKFKSRIYWGCFIVDHLLGVMLGRPPTLHIEDSTIQESDKVPDLDWIKEFNFQELDEIIDVANPLKAIVRLFLVVDDAIKDIFTAYGYSRASSLNGLLELHEKLNAVKMHNERIEAWKHGLDKDLSWTSGKNKLEGIETLEEKRESSPKMTHVFCYYVALLCINRPFIRRNEISDEDPIIMEQIRDLETHICNVIVKSLRDLCVSMTPYLNQRDSIQKPGSMLVIYAAVIGVSTVMVLGNSNEYITNGKRSKWLVRPVGSEWNHYNDNPQQLNREKELRYWFFTLGNVLESLRSIWVLAGKGFDMVDKKCKTEYGIGYHRALKEWEKECKWATAPDDPVVTSTITVDNENDDTNAPLDIPFSFHSPLDDLWTGTAFDVVDDGLFGALIPTELDTLFS